MTITVIYEPEKETLKDSINQCLKTLDYYRKENNQLQVDLLEEELNARLDEYRVRFGGEQ